MSKSPARIVIGALALAAALVVGCGDDSSSTTASESTPEQTVEAFYQAYQDEDGETACALFSAESRETAAEGFDSCEEAFQGAVDSGALDAVPDDFTIESSEIDGDTATVEATAGGDTNTISLVNEDGWKVDAAGSATGAADDDAAEATDSTVPDSTTP